MKSPRLEMAPQRWRHVWDNSPPPQYQGGRGHRLCATWPDPRESGGSRQRLAHHAPLSRSTSLPTGGRGMKSLCTGSSMGEPAPPGRVLTPPPIRGLSRVRAGRRRDFTSLPASCGYGWKVVPGSPGDDGGSPFFRGQRWVPVVFRATVGPHLSPFWNKDNCRSRVATVGPRRCAAIMSREKDAAEPGDSD
jgi:hypothetical protein